MDKTYLKTMKALATWIDNLRESADNGTCTPVTIFEGTKTHPFCIAGGWMRGFSERYSDLLYINKKNPEYALSLKVAINPTDVTDFDSLEMPINNMGYTDDTCIAIEREDNSENLAAFFVSEWLRIMSEQGVKI